MLSPEATTPRRSGIKAGQTRTANLAGRNAAIAERVAFLFDKKKLRFDHVLDTVAAEFHISREWVQRIHRKANKG